MKTTTTLLKMALVGLFLTLATTLFAQVPNPGTTIADFADLTVGTYDDGQPAVNPLAAAVLFYNPATDGPSITLNASLQDANDLTFTSYIWQEIQGDGTAITEVEEGNQITLTGLAPGYHRYRVYGLVETDEVLCQSDEFQDIVFFVLPPLAPTASAQGVLDDFCIDDVPAGQLALTANVVIDDNEYGSSTFPNPAVENFELAYRWYARFTPFTTTGDGTPVDIELTPGVITPTDGATGTFTTDYSALLGERGAGTYIFSVEVQYSDAIKDPGTREYARWSSPVTDFELVVRPVPGRPTITIQTVVD